jgi:hypothetical protein
MGFIDKDRLVLCGWHAHDTVDGLGARIDGMFLEIAGPKRNGASYVTVSKTWHNIYCTYAGEGVTCHFGWAGELTVGEAANVSGGRYFWWQRGETMHLR